MGITRRAILGGLAASIMSRGNGYAQDATAPTELHIGGGRIAVSFRPQGTYAVGERGVLAWIEKSAQAVTAYYGRFPVAATRVIIAPAAGAGVPSGKVFGDTTTLVRMSVGVDSEQIHLDRDWKMVHEFVHLALPRMNDRHDWLAEGLAVYVESIARVQAGHLSAETIWGEFVRDMHKGLPRAGDRGLDHTPTWGRRYWGGAIFCLMAELELRKRSRNRVGLQHALRGILARANYESEWPVLRALAVGDSATGLPVLTSLYQEMADKPVAPDLDAIWQELGIAASGGRARFDDTAALASVRVAITRPMSA